MPVSASPNVRLSTYTLLRTGELVGRKNELDWLSRWICGSGESADVRLLNLVAVGGVGKSALSWHFLRRVFPRVAPSFAAGHFVTFYQAPHGELDCADARSICRYHDFVSELLGRLRGEGTGKTRTPRQTAIQNGNCSGCFRKNGTSLYWMVLRES